MQRFGKRLTSSLPTTNGREPGFRGKPSLSPNRKLVYSGNQQHITITILPLFVLVTTFHSIAVSRCFIKKPRSEYIVCPLPFYANDGSDVRCMPEECGHQQARVEQQHLDSFSARPFMLPISPNDTFLVWFMNADNPRRILNYLKDYHHLLHDDYANAYYLISLSELRSFGHTYTGPPYSATLSLSDSIPVGFRACTFTLR